MRHKKRLQIYKVLVLVFVAAIFVWPKLLNQDAEIDNRALAIAIGIDVNNEDDRGHVLASAQLLVPVVQGQQSGKQEVFFGTGRTLAEALDYINVKIGRVLDFGQVGIIVFGEEKAKEDVLEDLKYLINNKVRSEATLFVAYNTEARELLKKANSLPEEATSSLNNLLKFNAQSTYMPNINMLEFLTDCGSSDGSSFIPILNIQSQKTITLSDGKTAQESGENTQEGSDDASKEEGKEAISIIVDKASEKEERITALSRNEKKEIQASIGATSERLIGKKETINTSLSAGDEKRDIVAVSTGEGGEEGSDEDVNEIKDVDRVYLFKDGKIVGKLTEAETRGLVWHNRDTHFGLVNIENVKIDDYTVRYLPCDLRAKNVDSHVSFVEGKPIITYTFKLQLSSQDLHEINENYDVKKAFSRTQINNAIKKSIQQRVKEDIERCQQKLVEQDVDALRIKQQFHKFRHRDYKRYIEQNPDFLQKVEIKYNFNIKFY